MVYLIITVLLDIFLKLNNLSNTMFIPLLFITSFPFLYKILNKKYYYFIFIVGIIYDLLFSNLMLLYVLIFLILGLITNLLYKDNLITIFIIFIVNIVLYYVLLFIFNYVFDLTFYNYKLFIILGSSLVLNFIYLIISLFVLKSHIFSNRKKLKY